MPELPPAEWATKPLLLVEEDYLGRVERAPSPQWSTFAGAAGGCWLAASPFNGAEEPLGLDQDGKPTLNGAWIRCRSERLAVEGDGLLYEAYQRSLAADPPASAEAMEDMEPVRLAQFEEGLVVFEDGSFSRGPLSLRAKPSGAAPPDAEPGSIALPTTAELEQCVSAGGSKRIRVRHTLAFKKVRDVLAAEFGFGDDPEAFGDISEEELEDLLMQQLRCTAHQESWAGPIGGSASGEPALPKAPKLSSLRRPTPRSAGGVWNVFVRAATPVSAEEAQDAASVPGTQARSDAPQSLWSHEAWEMRQVLEVPEGRPYPPADYDEEMDRAMDNVEGEEGSADSDSDEDGAGADAAGPAAPAKAAGGGFGSKASNGQGKGSGAAAARGGAGTSASGRAEQKQDPKQKGAGAGSKGGKGGAAAAAPKAGEKPQKQQQKQQAREEEEEDGEEEEDFGSTLWLPGGIIAGVELGTGPGGDGVIVRAGWSQDAGSQQMMEREYDGEGALMEVRYLTMTRDRGVS